ncbi:MAG: DDE-type integrase/transposase/recombinase [bacterium]
MPKNFKMDIVNIVEACPLPKKEVIAMFGMDTVRYYRWQKRYYFTNSLEDTRGAKKKVKTLKDIYRTEIVGIRELGKVKGYVIGPDRIVAELEDRGIIISHETARQTLHQEGLIKPRPAERKHEWRRFEAENPNDLWQTDILYVFIHGSGFHYLYSILDDHSRKLIHCALSPTATSREAVWTLKEAIKLAGTKPLAVLTDRGTQFYSGVGKAYGEFENYLQDNGIEHKVARYRHPQTLGKIERYHRTLRAECLRHYEFDDPIEAIRVIKDYNRKYSFERKHQGIGRVTPQDRYTGRDKEIKKLRAELRRRVREERRLQNLTEQQITETVAIQEIVMKLQPITSTAKQKELVEV